MSRNEQILHVLQGLVGRSQDVEGAMLVIISAGTDTVLAAISNGEAKLGMILYEMKLAARDLARELA